MWAHGDKRIVLRNSATFRNCLITGNRQDGIYGDNPTVENCTIADNFGYAVNGFLATIANSVVYFNTQGGGNLKFVRAQSSVTYSDVQGGWTGAGNLDADPLFVAGGSWKSLGDPRAGSFRRVVWMPGDYHLKSEGWTWDPEPQTWTFYDVTSPCIDAGDPGTPLGEEPMPEPGSALSERTGANPRINIGAYGGTAEASLAPRSGDAPQP
jgi:hypothetical protein